MRIVEKNTPVVRVTFELTGDEIAAVERALFYDNPDTKLAEDVNFDLWGDFGALCEQHAIVRDRDESDKR